MIGDSLEWMRPGIRQSGLRLESGAYCPEPDARPQSQRSGYGNSGSSFARFDRVPTRCKDAPWGRYAGASCASRECRFGQGNQFRNGAFQRLICGPQIARAKEAVADFPNTLNLLGVPNDVLPDVTSIPETFPEAFFVDQAAYLRELWVSAQTVSTPDEST